MADVCIVNFVEQLKGTSDDANQLIADIEREVKFRTEVNPNKTEAQHFDDVVNEQIDREIGQAQRDEIALTKAVEARQENLRLARGLGEQLGLTPVQSLHKMVEVQGNDVVKARSEGLANFVLDLEDAGLDVYFKKLSQDDVEAVKFLQEVGELAKGVSGRPGISGSKNAQQTAKIYQNTIDGYRARQKELGIKVDNLYGRMLRQSWYPDSLRRFGSVSEFVDAMLPRIDRARTFRRTGVSTDEVKKFLADFYNERILGVEEEVALNSRTLTRERKTFAAQAAAEREIFLNTAEDSLFVMKNFGDGDVTAGVVTAIQQSANKTRSTELFGINPRNTIDAVRQSLKEGATADEAADLARTPALDNFRFADIEHMMSIIDGSIEYKSSSPTLKMAVHSLANVTRFRFLGTVVFSATPDVSSVNRAAARIGATGLDYVSSEISTIFNKLDPKAQKWIAASADTANAYSVGSITQKVAPNSVMAKITNVSTYWSNWVMKFGGINWWTRQRKGTAYILGSSMTARQLGSKYSDLDKGFRNMLARGGVLKKEWDDLTRIVDAKHDAGEGHILLDLDRVKEVDEGLARRIDNALTQFTNEAVPTPGVRERAILTQGTDAGTVMGAVNRVMTSLLGYPLTFMTRQMGAEMEIGGARGRSGMAKLGASMLFSGYVAMVLKDLADGKTRDYLSDDPKLQAEMFLEAFGRGGFGGLASSVIIDSIRFGSPLSGIIGGAPAEVFDQAFNGLVKSIEYGAQGDIEKAASRFAQTARPFIAPLNIPQTKLLFDTMVYQPFLEMTNPQEMRRLERSWERRTNGDLNIFRE